LSSYPLQLILPVQNKPLPLEDSPIAGSPGPDQLALPGFSAAPGPEGVNLGKLNSVVLIELECCLLMETATHSIRVRAPWDLDPSEVPELGTEVVALANYPGIAWRARGSWTILDLDTEPLTFGFLSADQKQAKRRYQLLVRALFGLAIVLPLLYVTSAASFWQYVEELKMQYLVQAMANAAALLAIAVFLLRLKAHLPSWTHGTATPLQSKAGAAPMAFKQVDWLDAPATPERNC
jgi:hypothetical protein